MQIEIIVKHISGHPEQAHIFLDRKKIYRHGHYLGDISGRLKDGGLYSETINQKYEENSEKVREIIINAFKTNPEYIFTRELYLKAYDWKQIEIAPKVKMVLIARGLKELRAEGILEIETKEILLYGEKIDIADKVRLVKRE